MNSGIENNNRNSIKYRPITFDSAKKMFTYLQDVGDLYSPDERIYIFNYSESGALAVYRICELKAKELSGDSKKADEYWGAFLGPGESIYDVPDEQCDVDYAKKFCEYWYKSGTTYSAGQREWQIGRKDACYG